MRAWHPDKNPENLKVVWKLRSHEPSGFYVGKRGHHEILLENVSFFKFFFELTKLTLKVEEGVTCFNLAVVKLPPSNEDLLTQSPNRDSPVNKVLRHLCSWKQLRRFLTSAV